MYYLGRTYVINNYKINARLGKTVCYRWHRGCIELRSKTFPSVCTPAGAAGAGGTPSSLHVFHSNYLRRVADTHTSQNVDRTHENAWWQETTLRSFASSHCEKRLALTIVCYHRYLDYRCHLFKDCLHVLLLTCKTLPLMCFT